MSAIVVMSADELRQLIKEAMPAPTAPANSYMSADDIFEEFGIPKKTLDKLRSMREITYFTYSKSFRYERASVIAYIESTKVKVG